MDEYVVAASPIGDVYVAFGDAGVCCVVAVAHVARFEAFFAERFGRVARRRARVPRAIARALTLRTDAVSDLGLALDLRGVAAFDLKVLEETQRIRRGETRSYGQLAADIGLPRAARAVGTALGRNPMPLLIPCHRVIRSDGSAGEWGTGGTETKQRLLRLEGAL